MLRRSGQKAIGVEHALWLILVMSIPLLVNPYSRFNFEPDKAALLRALTILLVLACVLALPRLTLDSLRGLLSTVPLLTISLFGLITLASFLSVEPYRSLWGEPRWGQGWITYSCFLVIFGLAIRVWWSSLSAYPSLYFKRRDGLSSGSRFNSGYYDGGIGYPSSWK